MTSCRDLIWVWVKEQGPAGEQSPGVPAANQLPPKPLTNNRIGGADAGPTDVFAGEKKAVVRQCRVLNTMHVIYAMHRKMNPTKLRCWNPEFSGVYSHVNVFAAAYGLQICCTPFSLNFNRAENVHADDLVSLMQLAGILPSNAVKV